MTEKSNIILLVIDSLRYDYAMADPFFRELSERGLFFERMYGPSTFTNANMSSVRSGMYPPRHGWRSWPESYPLGGNIKTLEDFLNEAGYWLVNGINLPMKPNETEKLILNETLFMGQTGQEPFFLYSQFMNLHDGVFYKHPGIVDISESNYQSLIPSARDFIKTAFSRVEKRNFDNETLWVIMADHGIGLEKDMLSGEGHDVGGGQIYDFRNRLYCVLIGPSIKPEVRHNAYSLIDLLPSILDYCEIQPTIPDGFLEMQGVSVFDEPDPERCVYLEAQSPYSVWPSEQPNVFGTTDGKFKVMVTPVDYRLYDLTVDPEEKNNLLSFVDMKSMLELLASIQEIGE